MILRRSGQIHRLQEALILTSSDLTTYLHPVDALDMDMRCLARVVRGHLFPAGALDPSDQFTLYCVTRRSLATWWAGLLEMDEGLLYAPPVSAAVLNAPLVQPILAPLDQIGEHLLLVSDDIHLDFIRISAALRSSGWVRLRHGTVVAFETNPTYIARHALGSVMGLLLSLSRTGSESTRDLISLAPGLFVREALPELVGSYEHRYTVPSGAIVAQAKYLQNCLHAALEGDHSFPAPSPDEFPWHELLREGDAVEIETARLLLQA